MIMTSVDNQNKAPPGRTWSAALRVPPYKAEVLTSALQGVPND